ncbi:TetR/AcrR family transcriptional regulator [Mangrovicoccus ximenensis]|uniref:TetR/AcrR family transcriptional regulator n=1 Tax=Mangrovicoccus ximenensis TaxID=1911570 RepID=UPI00191BCD51
MPPKEGTPRTAGRDGRRRTPEQIRAARARILSAATAVFTRNGFHGATVDDIVREARVSKPTFYRHFPAKEASQEAIVAGYRSGLGKAVAEAAAVQAGSGAPLRDRAVPVLLGILDYMERNSAATRLCLLEAPCAQDTFEHLADCLAGHAAHDQARGALRADIPPKVIARVSAGMLRQIFCSAACPEDRAALAESYARLLSEGCAAGHAAGCGN